MKAQRFRLPRVKAPDAVPPKRTKDEPRYAPIIEYEAEFKQLYADMLVSLTQRIIDRVGEFYAENAANHRGEGMS